MIENKIEKLGLFLSLQPRTMPEKTKCTRIQSPNPKKENNSISVRARVHRAS
jgi:hypothetical protein